MLKALLKKLKDEQNPRKAAIDSIHANVEHGRKLLKNHDYQGLELFLTELEIHAGDIYDAVHETNG